VGFVTPMPILRIRITNRHPSVQWKDAQRRFKGKAFALTMAPQRDYVSLMVVLVGQEAGTVNNMVGKDRQGRFVAKKAVPILLSAREYADVTEQRCQLRFAATRDVLIMYKIMEFVSSTELIPRFVVTKVVQIKQKREVYVVLTVPRSITRNVNMKVVLVWSSTAAFVSGKQKLVIN